MRSAVSHFLHRASEYSARTKRTRSSCCYPDISSVASLDKLQTEQLSAGRKTFLSGFTERVHLYDESKMWRMLRLWCGGQVKGQIHRCDSEMHPGSDHSSERRHRHAASCEASKMQMMRSHSNKKTKCRRYNSISAASLCLHAAAGCDGALTGGALVFVHTHSH